MTNNKFVILIPMFLALASVANAAESLSVGVKAVSASDEIRISKLIKKMTLAEKFELIGGTGFGTKPIERLGIPSIQMIDGPQGVRGPRATAFPTSLATVATWNPELMRKVAAGIGREVRAIGKNMILGPCVSLYRVPLSGRNFECFGEDPFLNSRFSAAYVLGTHDSNILSSTKHFVLNDQEINRNWVDMRIDERSLRELELPAFQGAIKAGTESIMSSYNLVDGLHSAENHSLLTVLLKGEFQFKGLVVSDWESVYNGWNAFYAGLDLEMPLGDHMNDDLKDKIRSGELTVAQLNDKVRRILRALFSIHELDGKTRKANPADLNSKENRDVALATAEEAIVLLKNDNSLLPLKTSSLRSVAIIGPSAVFRRTSGGGSGEVSPLKSVSTYQGLASLLGPNVNINVAIGTHPENQAEIVEIYRPEILGGSVDGFNAEYFDNSNLKGKPFAVQHERDIQLWNTMLPVPGLKFDQMSARWTGEFVKTQAGPIKFCICGSGRGYRFYVDGQLVKDLFDNVDAEEKIVEVKDLAVGHHAIRLEYKSSSDNFKLRLSWIPPQQDLESAVTAAKNSDVAIVVVGDSSTDETEGGDRTSINLPGDQDKLIAAVLDANPRTIVVVNSGGPISMRKWRDRAPAILQAWFPGQEGGTAIAKVILGLVNPSGKLPITLPKDLADSPSTAYYHGQKDKINYGEVGILEGYRGYDAKAIEPEFAFGHGLSYTQFSYSNPLVTIGNSGVAEPRVQVTMTLTNSGSAAGAEVVQLYVGQKNPKVVRPPRELKGFQKIKLAPGETRTIKFSLDKNAFHYWDSTAHAWQIDPDQFTIMLGSSSRDIRSSSQVQLK